MDAGPGDPAARQACSALVEALPDRLAGLEPRDLDPPEAPAAAWGDPPIVLTCGVGMPPGFEPTSVCEEIDGVGWFVPPAQVEDPESDVLFTTVGFEPTVSVLLPAEHRDDPTAVTVPLAQPILDTLDLVRPCL